MKNYFILFILLSAVIFFSCKSNTRNTGSTEESEAVFVISDEVKELLDNSCYGCHNSESRNEDAKKELSLDKLDSLKSFVLIGIMEEIHEQLDSAKMPPAKFLERYPDRALTQEQKELLMAWASETSANLSGKKEE